MWSPKAQGETIDYDFSFESVLKKMRDKIATATVSIVRVTAGGDPSDVQLVIGDISHDDYTVKAYFSGGMPAVTYRATCTIMSAAGTPHMRVIILSGELIVTS